MTLNYTRMINLKSLHIIVNGHYQKTSPLIIIQTDRYRDATDICTNIIKSTSNEFILIGDDNIDTLSDTNAYKNFNNHEIKEIRHNFMIENSLISHHNKATFYRKGQASCLDHIKLSHQDQECHCRKRYSLRSQNHHISI